MPTPLDYALEMAPESTYGTAGTSWRGLDMTGESLQAKKETKSSASLRPGLMGALVVGLSSAKALASWLGKPLYGVNHLAGHVAVDLLDHGDLPTPCVALLVSGGHTQLLLVNDMRATARLWSRYSGVQMASRLQAPASPAALVVVAAALSQCAASMV